MKATGPAGGAEGAKVALSATPGSVLITPMQFGPTIRTPAVRTRVIRARSRSMPSPPISLKPAEMTTRPRTPAATHSSATASTCSFGTTITARSTGPGTAPIEG